MKRWQAVGDMSDYSEELLSQGVSQNQVQFIEGVESESYHESEASKDKDPK